ncbi:MAG: ROK family protein [Thermomicrobiales bacterium]
MAVRMRSANRRLMREMNESIVLGLIRRHEAISRVEIARAAQLSAATVTGITTSLIAHGLVREKATGVSTGGRRPILLSFNRKAGIAVGIKITERQLVCVATDLAGAEEKRNRVPLADGTQPADVVALIAAEVARLREAYAPRRVFGVGVGIAGVVDRPSGVCRLSPFLHWQNVPLRAALEAVIPEPVVVENDVNTLTFAFRSDVVPSSVSSFLAVTFGRGIGLGMILNGVPFRGARGQGGELGHITVESDGSLCECGKRGCLEAVASMPALIQEAARLVGKPLTEQEFRELVLVRDSRVAGLTDRMANVFGEALAILVNILNPDMVVLSGEGAWLIDHLYSPILQSMTANVFDGLSADLEVRVEERPDEFWAMGAARVLLDEQFRPRLEHAQETEGLNHGR